MTDKWIVITSINHPTTAIEHVSRLTENGWRAVVVGDRKTPQNWAAAGVDFLDIDNQHEMFGELSRMIPENHYCRKNLGYLYAIENGADCILETDDDNIPYPEFGKRVERERISSEVSGERWLNIYSYYSGEHIWPRGMPLDKTRAFGELSEDTVGEKFYPIQQYLADDDPDVDAVYRLLQDKTIKFDKRKKPISIRNGSWVPFNSQNTLFFKEAFPLMYLPCFVSFRMTDIWRSFVAQACLWGSGLNLLFDNATVRQERNVHNLLTDFEQEIPGYLGNDMLVSVLERALLEQMNENHTMAGLCFLMWTAANSAEFVPEQDLLILNMWLERLNSSLK